MKRTDTSLKPVAVQRIAVSADRVLALSPEERYAYYMLGHFFNELMLLQKLLAFALPKHDDNRPLRQQPEMGQVLFLFRIAAGKMWEAKLALVRVDLSRVLKLSFLPLISNGVDRLKLWRRRVAEAAWLKNLRNGHSFHYPDFKEWQPLLESSGDWRDDEIFMSEQSGNVFHAGADSMAQHWMFGQLNPGNPREAVVPMIDELIELLGQVNSLVEDLLGAFVTERLLDEGVVPEQIGSVASPAFQAVRIPFWTHMPAKSADKL